MTSENPNNKKKEFLGMHFHCCNIYSRIYKNREGTAYEGRCPRCGKPVVVPIGKGGVSNRFFNVY